MNEEIQVAKSFDKATLLKIAKGALYTFYTAALVGGAEALFNYLLTVDLGNPLITMLFIQIMGVAYNAFKEWRKGEVK